MSESFFLGFAVGFVVLTLKLSIKNEGKSDVPNIA